MSRLFDVICHLIIIIGGGLALAQCVKDENEWLLEQDRARAMQYISTADQVVIEITQKNKE